jgi:hypothetical protein
MPPKKNPKAKSDDPMDLTEKVQALVMEASAVRNEELWVCVMKDHFTKYHWTKAFKGKDMGPIANFILEVFKENVVPEQLHSDNGSEFVNSQRGLVREISFTRSPFIVAFNQEGLIAVDLLQLPSSGRYGVRGRVP